MKTRTALLIGLTLAVSAATTFAQGEPAGRGGGQGGPPGPGRGGLPPQMAAVLDADTNGVLSAAEIQAAPAALSKLDQNNDGQLTQDEFCPFGRNPPGRGPGRGMGICPWLDTDGDGVLSAHEIAGAAAALQALDLNKDGQLTGDEFRRGRGFGGGRGPGAPGAPGGRGRGYGGPPNR